MPWQTLKRARSFGDALAKIRFHLKVIACEVAAREFFYCAARSVNTMDITLKPQGLHDSSDACRKELQPIIDAVDPEHYAALFLGYGLCNNATVGIRAGRVRWSSRARTTASLSSLAARSATRVSSPGGPARTISPPAGLTFTSAAASTRRSTRSPASPAHGVSGTGREVRRGEREVPLRLDVSWETHSRGRADPYPFTRHLGLEEKVRAICAEKKWEFEEIRGSLKLIQDGLDGN